MASGLSITQCTSCGDVLTEGVRHNCRTPVAVGRNPVSQGDLLKALDALILQEMGKLEEADITLERLRKRAKCGKLKAKAMIEKWMAEGKLRELGKMQDPRGGRLVDAWRLVT